MLKEASRYELPGSITEAVEDWCSKYGRVLLLRDGERLILKAQNNLLMREIQHIPDIGSAIWSHLDARTTEINPASRGTVKRAMLQYGYPVVDEAGYTEGAPLEIDLKPLTTSGKSFQLREYQELAAQRFWADGKITGGCGVLNLPCGSGKTIIGLRVMQLARTRTLILAPGITAARQWIAEILDKTTLPREDVGEYSGEVKQIMPVTVATYHALTAAYRNESSRLTNSATPSILNTEAWGLVIYDEVHMLPAPMFRLSAELQSCRRLGLTGTLVREDGKELDVFSLIGPGRMDAHWKQMEAAGWIARADCTEVRVPMPPELRTAYAASSMRNTYAVAAGNPAKEEVVQHIVALHRDRSCLVMGQDLDQLRKLAARLEAPLIEGRVPNRQRAALYEDFRAGIHRVLVVSRVGNTSVDLPEARVAIQVSGMFGSRQEEAQRLGRILRPHREDNRAYFYSIVSEDTVEVDFAAHRQLYLIEQGYRYTITRWNEFREQAVI